jgi:hypothetical protein
MPVQLSTSARGYGHTHQQERAKWKRIVDAGQAECHAIICLEPTRTIWPGTPWDLGHTPDRTSYTGPEHTRCNRSEGARRGNQQRGRARRYWPL